MPAHDPLNINGIPNGVLTSVPSPVVTIIPTKFVPRLRAGYFYVEDRRYVLFSEKGSGYLEDITWYDWATADLVVNDSERVWVRGVEVTGTGHYRFRNGHLQINGASLSHPGVLIEQVNYDTTFLDPLDLGGVLDPDAQARIDYTYNEWVTGVEATTSIIDAGTTVAGILINVTNKGVAGDSVTIDINASGGAGSTATVTKTALDTYDIDWFTSTTVQTVIDAIEASDMFDAVADAIGTPGTDLFSALLTGASITPPDTIVFAGGINDGFTSSTASETFRLGDATPSYELPQHPANNLPVVMTDDRMQHWDRRNISPEFTVSKDNVIEFNTPRNYVSNPDFEADLDLWLTAGTPTVETEDIGFTLTHSFSASKYIELPTDSDEIGQFFPAFEEDEQLLSIVARGVAAQVLSVTLAFYDINWTSLGSSVTTHTMTGDWATFTFTGGPAGRIRTYDFAPPDDAAYVLLTLTPDTGDTDIQIDHVYWGASKLTPDMWHPHGRVTVEYDVSDEEYYVHDTLLTHDLNGETLANIIPLEGCNTHGATVSSENGFLYGYEYNSTPDFRLSLGGINSLIGEFNTALSAWPCTVTGSSVNEIVSDGSGGFYVVGNFTVLHSVTILKIAHVLSDGTIDPDFSITSMTGVPSCCAYDTVDDILYVGGTFTVIDGLTRNRGAALNGATGAVLAFDPDLDALTNSIAVDREAVSTQIFIGGDFTDVNSGTTRNRLASFDTTGTVLAWDPNIDDEVIKVILGDDRYLYASGPFTDVASGTTRERLARWDADSGVLDTTFDPDVTGTTVYDMALDGNNLYFGGAFTAVGGTTRNNVAAFDTVNMSLLSFDPDTDSDVNGIVVVDENVFLGGDFTTVGGITRNRLASLGTDGSLSNWDPGATSEINYINVAGGVIVISGTASTIATDCNKIAFMHYYDGKAVVGRRWLPYAKVNGLGKLNHVSYLGYNAEPWVKEVTDVAPVPTPTKLELLPAYGMTRAVVATTVTRSGSSTSPALFAGDTTITMPGAYGLIQTNDFVYIQTKVHENNNAFQIKEVSATDVVTLRRPLPEDITHNTVMYAEYKILRGFVGQQRVVRLRLTDQHGAPVGQKELTIVNEDPDVVSLAWDLPTNQDGEASYLLTFLKIGTAKLMFSGSGSVTLNVDVAQLPTPDTIPDTSSGPIGCASAYSVAVATWI